MSDRRENSVLFSLKELRQIEDDRVRREQDEVRAREEAARRAQEEAIRRAREEEENKKRAEEDRLRRIEEEKVAREREERLRLEEAERRHRVEAEARLREEKMRLEIQAAAQAKSPLKAILVVTVVLVAIAGGLGWKMYTQHQAEKAAIEQQLAAERERLRQAELNYEKERVAIRKDMEDKLAAAKSEAERAQIRQEAQAREAAAAAARTQHASKTRKSDATAATPKVGSPKVPGKVQIDDNPLGGL